MTGSATLALVHNAALLLAMALIYDALAGRDLPVTHKTARKVVLGLFVGTVGIAVMLSPYQAEPGILFDTRSVLLGISGLFFGAVPTVIAIAMTATLRVAQGGEGVGVGVAVIVASGCIGLAWHRLRGGRLDAVTAGELYGLGIAIHVTMLALMFLLPWTTAIRVLSAIALPVIVIYPIATVILGMLLTNHLRRKALVGRLAENEERLRRALQAGRQGIYDVDVSAGMVTVDAEYARVLGFDPATNGERVADWIGRLHADDRARADAHYRDYVAGRLPEYRVEFRMRMGDGSWRWVLSVGRIVARDPSGMPMRMLGTHTDITAEKEAAEKLCLAQAQSQRLIAEGDQSRLALLSVVEDLKAAEDSLVESEAFYRGLFENMHEGFAYCRMIHKDGQPHDFVYLRVNASFEQMRAIAHATNRRASEVLPDFPAANPELFAAYARVAASGTAEVLEVNIVRLSRWFLVSVFCPHPDHFVSAWIDITEKKRTEIDNRERLEELSRWYKATLGRESRVIELKSEVNDLLRRLGEPPRYSPAPATRNGEPG